jgi:HD-like signal output (HDOD) protein/prolyl-tRNA editing enzyme YbaK/EbsC (Cys-tRNA(Pro) deacylase)
VFSFNKARKRNEQSVNAVRDVASYLTNNGVNFEIVQHPRSQTLEDAARCSNIKPNHLLRTVILQDDDTQVMAILPSDRLLDFSVLCQFTGREMVPVSKDTLASIFSSCEVGSYPPLPYIYNLNAIIDSYIHHLDDVYFEPGTHDVLIKISGKDFLKLHKELQQADFSCGLEDLESDNVSIKALPKVLNQFLPARMRDRIEDIIELPAIPAMANEILELRSNPDATSVELAQVIEKDPSLAAQLMSWAQSPYYRYGGKVTSVECAIVKVLGFDLVMNLAVGIAISRSLSVPLDGPLGLRAHWRFSIYTSALVEALVNQMPVDKRPVRGLAYLSGLLHNFGHLVLAHVFPPHFYILNHYIQLNPHICITKIERHVLGVPHQQIGAWLTGAWHLPGEITSAVRWHHQEEYSSEFSVYSNLVFVAIRLLKRFDIGDADDTWLPDAVLESLGIDEVKVEKALDYVIERRNDLCELANKLT